MGENAVFTLSDGKEIQFDFSHISRREFRALFSPAQSDSDGDNTIAKITGLPVEYLTDINQLDYARIVREIALRGNRPDPT